jgi:CAAX protease family protein
VFSPGRESPSSPRIAVTDPPVASSTTATDRFAARLRGFGPVGILTTLLILLAVTPWMSAILVLAWVHVSRTAWSEIGYRRPTSWVWSTLAGIGFGIAFKLAMKAVVMPLLGADPINQAYHYLAGNRPALPGMIFAVTIGAGFGEETVFRGFLFARLRALFGKGRAATIAIVLLTSAWFSVLHYPGQGLPGMQQAAITGLVIGTIFAVSGRIWMLMVLHSAFDLTALALIYWNLETRVAHWVYR